jgi:hypothetical protein
MRGRRWLALASLAVVALVTAGVAISDNGSTNNKNFEYTVGLWGDLPYNDVQAQT